MGLKLLELWLNQLGPATTTGITDAVTITAAPTPTGDALLGMTDGIEALGITTQSVGTATTTGTTDAIIIGTILEDHQVPLCDICGNECYTLPCQDWVRIACVRDLRGLGSILRQLRKMSSANLVVLWLQMLMSGA